MSCFVYVFMPKRWFEAISHCYGFERIEFDEFSWIWGCVWNRIFPNFWIEWGGEFLNLNYEDDKFDDVDDENNKFIFKEWIF